jgi:hypothetical protein
VRGTSRNSRKIKRFQRAVNSAREGGVLLVRGPTDFESKVTTVQRDANKGEKGKNHIYRSEVKQYSGGADVIP